MRRVTLWLVLAVLSWLVPLSAGAAPDPFAVSPLMRDRVDFWIDIFTRYGRYQDVFHHRDYPGVIFRVLDYRDEAKILSPKALSALRKRRGALELEKIGAVLEDLAAGRPADTTVHKLYADRMAVVPGGAKKYQRAVDEDLIRMQTGIRERFAEAVQRSGRYIRIMEAIFHDEYGLPIELTRLPFIESSFDYKAYSSVGAAGIWQFMPGTARRYMTVNSVVDERRDVITSTRAAAQYLKHAYGQLGSWPLAITSYNHGITGVKRKVAEIGSRDIVTIVEHPAKRVLGFASNNFYPEFLAALEVFDNYHTYFPEVKLEGSLQISEHQLPHSASIAHLVRQLGVSVETLREYNYALSDKVWRGYHHVPKGYKLRIPPRYAANVGGLKVPETVGQSASAVHGGITYTVRPGDNLFKIGHKYGVSVATLQRLNGLTSSNVQVGQKLRIKQMVEEKREITSSAEKAVTSGSAHTVQRGDTLSGISAKYGLTTKQLRSWNQLSSDLVRPGQIIRLSAPPPTPHKEVRYKVRSGDTLWSIGKRFGVSIKRLKARNPNLGTKLKIGQVVVIP